MKQKIAIKIPGYAGVLLLLAFLVCFMNKVDTSLIYYWQQSVALPVGEALQYPGGISGLLGDRFLECLVRPVFGSFMLAIFALGFIISLAVIFRKEKNKPVFFVLLSASMIPLFFLFPDYKFPFHSIMMVFTAQVLTAILSLYTPGNKVANFLYLLAGGLILYLFSGVPGLIILAQLIVIRSFISKKYHQLILLPSLFVIPLIYLPFNLSYSLKSAYLGTLVIPDYGLPLIYLILILIPILFFLILSGMNQAFSKISAKRQTLISGVLVIIMLAGIYPLTKSKINESVKNTLQIEQASFTKDWDRVLMLATKLEVLNRQKQVAINRALANSGKLLDSLFWTPQPLAEKGIFLEDDKLNSRWALYLSDFYYDLGYASETRHWSMEAQMVLMRNPLVLKNLIISTLAQGDIMFAKKYLKILSQSPLNKDWCEQIDEKISNNSILDDIEIARFVDNNPNRDFFAGNAFPIVKLSEFYENNTDNYLAFEFLIASYLFQNEVDMVVNKLTGFRSFGIEKLPRNVEEAILIYMMKTKADTLSELDYSVSQNTIKDFKEFNRLMIASKNMDDAKHLVSKYRMSYWYYFLFTSPYRSNK
ncbi:MAG: DUF6057 family protein [Bacteroidales bacterium]|nr:DUF6057 family protein [Bacteroidales bacterium]MCF8391973.1 DUF6057 family protein [Bacteroidales bacterium]